MNKREGARGKGRGRVRYRAGRCGRGAENLEPVTLPVSVPAKWNNQPDGGG